MNLATLRILWIALLFSHAIYGVALSYVLDQQSPPEKFPPMIVPIIVSLSIIVFFAAIYLPRFILNVAKGKLKKLSVGADISYTKIEDLIVLFAPIFILRLALLEAVALFGFVLAFMQKDIDFFIPFAMASVVAYFLNYPTEEKIKKAFN
jgi:hypothetical protein